MNASIGCANGGPCYSEVATGPTLVSMKLFAKHSRYTFGKYFKIFAGVALLSGVSTYAYAYVQDAQEQGKIPASCIESIYILKVGQHATCHDPRSRINIVSKTSSDVAFMCKCIESQ